MPLLNVCLRSRALCACADMMSVLATYSAQLQVVHSSCKGLIVEACQEGIAGCADMQTVQLSEERTQYLILGKGGSIEIIVSVFCGNPLRFLFWLHTLCGGQRSKWLLGHGGCD